MRAAGGRAAGIGHGDATTARSCRQAGMGSVAPTSLHAHCATTLLAHVVWSTHRRAAWLEVSIDRGLASWLGQLAKRLGAEAIAVGNAADHVHVVVRHPPSAPLSYVVQRLKGGSAHAMRAVATHAGSHVWQVGYWAESVSPRELPAITEYVRNQRTHHDRHPAASEAWESCARREHPQPARRAGFHGSGEA